jgi:Arc/MetJ family transcription regulator
MGLRKTSVEIDEILLHAVQETLSTDTIKATIDAAFREILRARARQEEIAALTTLHGMDLADPVVMAGAWRA